MPHNAAFTAACSPPGSPARNGREVLVQSVPQPGSRPHVRTRSAHITWRVRECRFKEGARAQVMSGSAGKVQVWRHRPPAGKRAHGQAQREAAGPHASAGSSLLEEPVVPPQHVKAHVSAWQRQQAVYRGALQPGIAMGDPAFLLPTPPVTTQREETPEADASRSHQQAASMSDTAARSATVMRDVTNTAAEMAAGPQVASGTHGTTGSAGGLRGVPTVQTSRCAA